ncbi:MAG: DUF2948 family protein [Holosporales bacterium]|jgi:hypothetical protein|nr:DUF2948 family protein [Holosporales bacterium]
MTESTASSSFLRIKARDPQEMDILSALVQDAILHKTALFYDKKEKRVHLLVNRFCWECAFQKEMNASSEPYYRVHSGLYFHHVERMWTNAVFRSHPADKLLVLLTVYAGSKNHVDDKGDGNESDINLVFSEGAHVRLSTQQCCAYLKDLHDKWPTTVKPEHS